MSYIEAFKQGLGKRIKFLRETSKGKKLTQGDLADSLPSVSRANLGRIEKGEIMASAIFIKEVSHFFNVSADWVLRGDEENPEGYVKTLFEQEIIAGLRRLNDIQQRDVLDYISFKIHKSEEYPEIAPKLRITESPGVYSCSATENIVYIPILGTAAAGNPMLAVEEYEGFVSLPESKELAHNKAYLVRIKGDSMIEDGIHDSDLVLIRPQPVVENNEIALVKYGGEVTVKHFIREEYNVRLKAANQAYSDIIINNIESVKILGKVIKVIPQEVAEKSIRYFFKDKQ